MFDLDAAAREAREASEPFLFTLDGREWSLPAFTACTPEHIRLLSDRDLVALVESLTGDDELVAALQAVPFRALDSLIGGWIRSGGVEPGESSASTDS